MKRIVSGYCNCYGENRTISIDFCQLQWDIALKKVIKKIHSLLVQTAHCQTIFLLVIFVLFIVLLLHYGSKFLCCGCMPK